MTPDALRVVAAVLVDRQGQVLIAQRPPGKWQAGRWEFPGGKLEPGEDEAAAMRRELAIGLWLVLRHEGEPVGLDGQALRWVTPDSLETCDLLEADLPMLPALRAALGG